MLTRARQTQCSLFIHLKHWQLPNRRSSSKQHLKLLPSDPLGLPVNPSWSVHDLINSYPSPKLSEETLTRLHHLAALIPPREDSSEFSELKKEMEDLIRLVEAVRGAPTGSAAPVIPAIEVCEGHLEDTGSVKEIAGLQTESPPDGRIWPKGWGMNIEREDDVAAENDPPAGRDLLKEAKRTKDGFYVVDSTKRKAT